MADLPRHATRATLALAALALGAGAPASALAQSVPPPAPPAVVGTPIPYRVPGVITTNAHPGLHGLPFTLQGDVFLNQSVTVNAQHVSARARLDVPILPVFGLSAAYLVSPSAPGIGIWVNSPYIPFGWGSRLAAKVGGAFFTYAVPRQFGTTISGDLEVYGRLGVALTRHFLVHANVGTMFLAHSEPFDLFVGLQLGGGIEWLAF